MIATFDTISHSCFVFPPMQDMSVDLAVGRPQVLGGQQGLLVVFLGEGGHHGYGAHRVCMAVAVHRLAE